MPFLGLPAPPDPLTQEMLWAPVWWCRRASALVVLMVRGTWIETSFLPAERWALQTPCLGRWEPPIFLWLSREHMLW